jgi:hypothetical protein
MSEEEPNNDLPIDKVTYEEQKDPEQYFKDQLNMMNEFADTIRTKQLERLFMLSETKEIELDGKKYQRRMLTSKQHRRLVELDNQVSTSTDNVQHMDYLIALRMAEGEFYFSIPPDVVDAHYEELEDTLDACLLKTYTGIKGSEIQIPEILEQFKKRYDNSLNPLKSLR